MNRIIVINLADDPTSYRVQEDAYGALDRYLDEARSGLVDDPDQAEVMADVERSIAGKLAERLGGADRIVTAADIEAVLAAVGPVGEAEARAPKPAPVVAGPHRRRRLYRISEDQWFAGVCQGLAAYTEIRVDWVRTIFIFASLATAGLAIVVYLVLAFVLPVVPDREAWIAALDEA